MLADHLVDPLGPPNYPIDVTGGWTDWGMLGNGPDKTLTITTPNGPGAPVGNCTFCGRQHLRQCKAACAGITEVWETSNQLVTEYLEYDHDLDEGADIPTLLLAWYKAEKILAFARVDHTNVAECDAAMDLFKGLYAGVSLTDDADQLFEEQKPWTVADGQRPDPEDGHCIVKAKATGQLDTWLTWGAEEESTLEWTAACVEELYVLITQEDAHLVDLPKLQAAIEAFAGTGA
jgi:hypothetical protein